MPDSSATTTLNSAPAEAAETRRTGRLIVDEPARGSWNMAVDAAILERVQPGDPPTLRFYRWLRPTLSLGYFQASDDRFGHTASGGIDWVRRSTGGGAIVHDLELTYSVVMPQAEGLHGADHSLYETVHQAVIHSLEAVGVTATRVGDASQAISRNESFLCFQRRTEQDLIVSGYKILGSAQRRGLKGILQHGSLLIGSSQAAPELPGLLNLCDKVARVGQGDEQSIGIETVPHAQNATPFGGMSGAERVSRAIQSLTRIITGELASAWRIDWTGGGLTESERETARKTEENRFTQPQWNFKR